MKKKISILSPTLSGNAVGRAYLLAKLLQEDYHVTIVGPGNIDELWSPIKNDISIEYRSYQCKNIMDLHLSGRSSIFKLIDGDIIYAVKPLFRSFGIGLMAKLKFRKPLLLDIDDWEIGFLLDRWHWELRYYGLKSWLFKMDSSFYTRSLDKMTRFSDGVTVSNSFLQYKYGGCWIPHARDERLFEKIELKKSNEAPSILFLGTPRGHKGLDVLLEAWRAVDNKKAKLRIVGISKSSSEYGHLSTFAYDRISFEEPVPFEKIPQIIRNASIIVIPQLARKAALGQLPAKLIDAMAAGVPIIATAVGDIPLWLSGNAGIIIPPGDKNILAKEIDALLKDEEKRNLLGLKAKEKFLRFGSFKVLRPKLISMVEYTIGRHKHSESLFDSPYDILRSEK